MLLSPATKKRSGELAHKVSTSVLILLSAAGKRV